MDITFIKASAEDTEAIFSLYRRAASAPSSDWDEEYPGYWTIEEDLDKGALYKVEIDGQEAGAITITPFDPEDDPENTPQSWIGRFQNPCVLSRFGLLPEMQGKGIGRKIIYATLDFARQQGYDGALLLASQTNKLTIHLYETMGFARLEELTLFDEYPFIAYAMPL